MSCEERDEGTDSKVVWSPTGTGVIEWAEQFREMANAGYRDAVSLETHWYGGANPEDLTRTSWEGMKKALQNAAVCK